MKKFIFYCVLVVSYAYYIYDSYKLIEYLDTIKIDKNNLEELKASLSLLFKDYYPYNEISKNPPQPDFDNNYHKKIDIQKLIKGINTENISIYKFYREIKKIISELKDPNIYIDLYKIKYFNILKSLFFEFPIDFVIKKINDKIELYGAISKLYKNDFDPQLINEIEKYINSNIISINGQNPFDFISSFGGNIESTKNIHGTFTRKFNRHNFFSLIEYPLDLNELNMEIIFNSGKK